MKLSMCLVLVALVLFSGCAVYPDEPSGSDIGMSENFNDVYADVQAPSFVEAEVDCGYHFDTHYVFNHTFEREKRGFKSYIVENTRINYVAYDYDPAGFVEDNSDMRELFTGFTGSVRCDLNIDEDLEVVFYDEGFNESMNLREFGYRWHEQRFTCDVASGFNGQMIECDRLEYVNLEIMIDNLAYERYSR